MTPSAEAWLELSVSVDLEAVETVSEILGRVASGGTSVEPAFRLVDEGLGAEVDPTGPAIVRGYVPAGDADAVRAAVAATTAALDHLTAFDLRPIGELRSRLVQEADWAEAWKAHFPVIRVGRRIVVRPTWRRHRRLPADAVIALDPGMAFGTGLHPTTRLCLAALESVADRGVLDGARVLDVGCGSGILAIAAARLGAAAVLGLDTDPIAVEATISNARRNRLVRRIRARVGSVPSGEGLPQGVGPPRGAGVPAAAGERPPSDGFDVVLANLIASVLIQLAEDLTAEVRPGGILVASGIFIDREPDVRSALEAAGLVVDRRTAEGEWVALEAHRPA